MRIERGFWLSLLDRRKASIIYQCATDVVSDDEFLTMWNMTGKVVLRALRESKDTCVEFEIRAQKLL